MDNQPKPKPTTMNDPRVMDDGVLPRDDDAPFPGDSPETLDDLRQECSLLRRRVENLEADKSDLAAQVAAWKRWYVQSYRAQIEYLDGEVARLCALAPVMPADKNGTAMKNQVRAPPVVMSPPGVMGGR